MKKSTLALLILAALALSPLSIQSARAEAEKRTLTGLYGSGFQDGPRPLRAVFTATGERTWDVVFYFVFNGRNHEYRGIAEGDLLEGPLSGRVQNEPRRRTFTFRGEFEDGTFQGDHFEISRGRERKTGSLSLGG